jgi:arabinogalactan oligomer/maltooligosaccharide transport system substrate-binding protein
LTAKHRWAAKALVGVLLVVGFGVVAVSVLRASAWADRRYGAKADTLPDWIAAVSTYAAFLAAGVAVYFAWRAFRIEAKREARWELDQRSAQASKVSAWYGTKVSQAPLGASELITQLSARTRRGVLLRNASEAPVYDVSVFVIVRDETRLNPEDVVWLTKDIGLLPPMSEPVFRSLEADIQTEFPSDAEPRVQISFTDAAGVEWIRSPYGQLREAKS